jgi:predicted hydrocarbon binding protein
MAKGVQRKTVFPFHYSPDERMVHVLAKLTDEPGTLASLLSVLGTKVNLVGTSSYSTSDGAAIFSGFGKILSSSNNAHSIQKHAAKAPSVLSCQVWEDKEGLLVDRFHTGFQAGFGEPYLMFPLKGLSDTFERIVKTFGSGGQTILYTYGLDYGMARAPLYKSIMGEHPETRLDELTAIVGALGYAASTATFESSGKVLKLTARECFECSTPTTTERKCAFLRGMAVGIFSTLFNKELVCEETKCRQEGNEECEFVLRAKGNVPLY